MQNVHILLPCIAIGLAIVGIAKPVWPAVAVILLAINALIK